MFQENNPESVNRNQSAKLEIVSLTDQQFIDCNNPNILDVTIRPICEVDPIVFAQSKQWQYLRSLDMSRLVVNDYFIKAVAENFVAPKLVFFDLTAVRAVGFGDVQALTLAVKEERLPILKWLELLGTEYDASPYVDGHCWRMTDLARYLGKSYGFQDWMMLGSRDPEQDGIELLPCDERERYYQREFYCS